MRHCPAVGKVRVISGEGENLYPPAAPVPGSQNARNQTREAGGRER
jgi:hypothetical protein